MHLPALGDYAFGELQSGPHLRLEHIQSSLLIGIVCRQMA
jgi:hypothetical protein